MTRSTAMIAFVIVVAVALAMGQGNALLRSVERGIGYGIGHELVRDVLHGR
jgi:hypothetical protein